MARKPWRQRVTQVLTRDVPCLGAAGRAIVHVWKATLAWLNGILEAASRIKAA
jgi:hypothetical protein